MGACLGKQTPAEQPAPSSSYQQQVDVVQASTQKIPDEHVQKPLIEHPPIDIITKQKQVVKNDANLRLSFQPHSLPKPKQFHKLNHD